MAAFKPGIGMILAETNVPVIPCYLDGCFEAFPADAKRPKFSKISLYIGKPKTFNSVKNGKAGWMEVATALEKDVFGVKEIHGSK